MTNKQIRTFINGLRKHKIANFPYWAHGYLGTLERKLTHNEKITDSEISGLIHIDGITPLHTVEQLDKLTAMDVSMRRQEYTHFKRALELDEIFKRICE